MKKEVERMYEDYVRRSKNSPEAQLPGGGSVLGIAKSGANTDLKAGMASSDINSYILSDSPQ